MKRVTDSLELAIINDMDMSLCSQERKFIKRIYTKRPPEKTIGVLKLMDALILLVSERNHIETRKRKRWDEEDIRKLELCNGEIRGLCYALGLDARL